LTFDLLSYFIKFEFRCLNLKIEGSEQALCPIETPFSYNYY